MTIINNEEAVRSLVYVHDLAKMGLEAKLPTSMKNFQLTQELLQQHIPSHEERAAMIAYQSCYFAYLLKNGSGTYDEFRQIVNLDAVQKITQDVIVKIPEVVSVDDLKELFRVQFLNLTAVDKNRQIKLD